MLKLTRQESESIILYNSDGEIVVRNREVTDNWQVRVGIDAPNAVKVLREELIEADQS